MYPFLHLIDEENEIYRGYDMLMVHRRVDWETLEVKQVIQLVSMRGKNDPNIPSSQVKHSVYYKNRIGKQD